MVHFETGSLSKEELEAMLNTLPVDVTFVDKEDTVRYFSQPGRRIFSVTRADIGRKVQQCHSQKSVGIVNKILKDLKSGYQVVEEYGSKSEGRLIHTRYFALRNKNGDYLGCMQVDQDITDIKKIEGEKKLL